MNERNSQVTPAQVKELSEFFESKSNTDDIDEVEAINIDLAESTSAYEVFVEDFYAETIEQESSIPEWFLDWAGAQPYSWECEDDLSTRGRDIPDDMLFLSYGEELLPDKAS